MEVCSFLNTISLSLVSLAASLPGVLSVYCVCLRSAWGPSSSFTDSSFLLVIILFPFLSLLRVSVLRFRVYSANFSLGCHLHSVSELAFLQYCLLGSHGLFSPSLAVLGLSARLPFQHFPIVSLVRLPLSVPPVRRFTFLFSRSSDSVESPVPSATGPSLWAESVPY